MRARLFWVLSRLAIFFYRRFPIFGPIPGAIAVIRRGGGLLAIERSDGLGLGLPGGIIHPRESAETALRREVREETGLSVVSAELKLTFEASAYYPVRTSVFEVTAKGEVHSSWEGRAVIVTLSELEQRILESQRPVLAYLNDDPSAPLAANSSTADI